MDFRILHFSASFYIELLIFVVNLYEAAILGQCWLVRCDGSSVSQHAIHLVTLIVDARSLSQVLHTKFNQKGEPGIRYTLHKGYPQNRRENGCLENDLKLEPTFWGDQPPKYPIRDPLLPAEEQNRDRMRWQKEQERQQTAYEYVFCVCLLFILVWSLVKSGRGKKPASWLWNHLTCYGMKPIMNIGLFWQAILSEQRKVPFFFTNRWNSSKSSVLLANIKASWRYKRQLKDPEVDKEK